MTSSKHVQRALLPLTKQITVLLTRAEYCIRNLRRLDQ